MPCYRCGARQTDPARGASRWRRGVRRDAQVLICPECQRIDGWAGELDACDACRSPVLICRLGEVECRECGHVRLARRARDGPRGHSGPDEGGAEGLSEEVAQALDRLLGGAARGREYPPSHA